MAKRIEELSDRELDAYIAEHFFKLDVIWKDDDPFYEDKDEITHISLEYDVPHYTSTIRDGWRIVDTLRDRGLAVRLLIKKEMVQAAIESENGEVLAESEDEWVTRALARAAAKAGKSVEA